MMPGLALMPFIDVTPPAGLQTVEGNERRFTDRQDSC